MGLFGYRDPRGTDLIASVQAQLTIKLGVPPSNPLLSCIQTTQMTHVILIYAGIHPVGSLQ